MLVGGGGCSASPSEDEQDEQDEGAIFGFGSSHMSDIKPGVYDQVAGSGILYVWNDGSIQVMSLASTPGCGGVVNVDNGIASFASTIGDRDTGVSCKLALTPRGAGIEASGDIQSRHGDPPMRNARLERRPPNALRGGYQTVRPDLRVDIDASDEGRLAGSLSLQNGTRVQFEAIDRAEGGVRGEFKARLSPTCTLEIVPRRDMSGRFFLTVEGPSPVQGKTCELGVGGVTTLYSSAR